MSFQMDFQNTALQYQGNLSGYHPFPTYSKHNAWESLLPELKEELLKQGEEALTTPFPPLRASDYMAFLKNGSRIAFETPYFARRHILNKLVLAECIEGKGRFMDAIVDGIWAICEESTWCLPAHNSYLRNTPQVILPDINRPVMDLFACETGELLSMILYLMEDALNEISPLIAERMKLALRERIISPYLSTHFWWMGNGDEPMCNWTPWCTQNVLLSTFLVPDLADEEEKKNIFEKAAASCDFFLKDYGEDGCCDEGAGYYRHAGLCLFTCLEVLNGISNNAFSFLYDVPKIKNIAAYISNIHVDGPYYFNFADCSAKAGRCGVREYLFGKATSQKFLMDFAACDFHDSFKERNYLVDESLLLNLYFKVQTVIKAKEVLDYHDSEGAACSPAPDIYYESVGIWTARNEDMTLAVKAGDNDDNHNHNDAGSIIVYKKGHPVLVDIGVETYTKKTFSANRYEIWTMQSRYHNLPIIEGQDEGAGREFAVSELNLIEDPDKRAISMNLSTAYTGKNLPSYTRTVEFCSKNSTIILTDESESENVILNFITYNEPVVCNDLTIKLGDAMISYTGASSPVVETLPITDARLKATWDHDLYRIQLTKSDKAFRMVIK